MNSGILEKVRAIIPGEDVLTNEPMNKHTTFRTGGSADYFIHVHNEKELSELIALFNDYEEEYTVIGNGSNLLVSDKGYSGTIICMMNALDSIKAGGNRIVAGAGALNSQIAAVARDHSLSGFEFASGIPGTIGGAMVMNAGAYGSEMADVTESITAIDSQGKGCIIRAKDMKFGYRKSIIREHNLIVTSCTLLLHNENREEINAKMTELAARRRDKQPLDFPSAGSTFKRPDGYFAGKLIMEAGLSGYDIGGAEVSKKHCGFIINTGDATSQNIYDLIMLVQKRVLEKSGVKLEPEIVMLGKFGN